MIQIKNLSKIYRSNFFRISHPALKDITLEVSKGDLFGFIGPNGAGKSTTIKVLLGLLKPTQGEGFTVWKAPFLCKV